MFWIVAFVVMLILLVAASRRFERDAIRRGRWDTQGPLVEIVGPEGGRGGMD